MTRVLLIAHAPVASALLVAARGILGPAVDADAFDVGHDRSVDELQQELGTWLQAHCAQGAVLVLTDLPGATPHNLASRLSQAARVPVVTGLNLGMLLRALNHAEQDPQRLAVLAEEGGHRSIGEGAAP